MASGGSTSPRPSRRPPAIHPATGTRLRSLFPGGLLAGQAAAIVDQRTSIVAHIPWALGLLALTTFTLLFAFTGSVVLPLRRSS